MTRSGKFHLICNSPNLFPLKWLRMTQNGQFCPIYNFCNLSPPKWLRMTRNCEFHPICNFSNVFQLKWLRMTRNGQFCTICNFSNLFRLKWPRMTWNGQFHLIRNFSNLFPLKLPRMTWNGQFCMAKIKCTLIQGNFYERLPFYMDSCALSLMASLFIVNSVLQRIGLRGTTRCRSSFHERMEKNNYHLVFKNRLCIFISCDPESVFFLYCKPTRNNVNATIC